MVTPVLANLQDEAIRAYPYGWLHPAGSQGRDGGQAAEIAIPPFHTAEMQRVFPDDDTSPPFCHNLNCLKGKTVFNDEKQNFKENVSVE
jgi:hypothetical protein